jgi:hypothetical protein
VGVVQDGERVIVVRPADGPAPTTADLLGAHGAVPPREGLPPSGPDRLVPPPGSGAARWWAHVRVAAIAVRHPLLVLWVAGDALPGFFLLRIADAVVLAPLLSQLADSDGVLLVPLVVLIGVGLSSLLAAVCLAGTIGLVTGWAADGRPPRAPALLTLVGHRIWVVWISLAVVHGLDFAMSYALPALTDAGLLDPRGAPVAASFVGWVLAAVGWVCTVLVGVLGPVLLFERRRGVRRAIGLLRYGPPVPVIGLAVTSAVLTLLPPWAGDLAEQVSGAPVAVLVGLVVTMACTAAWAVSATVTYAALVASESADRGDHGPVTAVFLRDSLAAEQA